MIKAKKKLNGKTGKPKQLDGSYDIHKIVFREMSRK